MFRWFNCRVHQRIHSEEKPYRCSELDKAFTQAPQLTNQIIYTGENVTNALNIAELFKYGPKLKVHQVQMATNIPKF